MMARNMRPGAPWISAVVVEDGSPLIPGAGANWTILEKTCGPPTVARRSSGA